VFFDSRAAGFFRAERVSNTFHGAGPHVGLDLWRTLGGPELAVFARIEGASLLGKIEQEFEETFEVGATRLGGGTTLRQTQAVPVVNAQLGLAWTPRGTAHWLRFSAGYQVEQWWSLGDVSPSQADLTVQGLFLRGEWSF
jgi:hypothetical protein